MGKLILVRHGQSEWNDKNIFTGWVDVALSQVGIDEAYAVGLAMKEIRFDKVFVSALLRAKMTAFLALSKSNHKRTPILIDIDSTSKNKNCLPDKLDDDETLLVSQSAIINERDYGALAGKNKDSVRKKYGEEQFKIWRRSYDVPPPGGESLKMTIDRVRPFFNDQIIPAMKAGETVLISAHGNSLRGMMMIMENISEEDIVHLEIATGTPIVFDYLDGTFTRGAL